MLFLHQNEPENLDPSYKMVLDLKVCFGVEKKSYNGINMILSS